MVEEAICRICFAGDDGDGDGDGAGAGELVSPCRCVGSQKYVHVSCLRKWQRSVQLSGSNHPAERAREIRHKVCNVCNTPFDLPAQDRAELMADLAHMRPEQVAPGVLLLTKKSASDSVASGSQLSIALRAFVQAKAAHFQRAVYILTQIRPSQSNDGGDCVLGVNLSRPLDALDISRLEGAASPAAIRASAAKGVDVMWMNGGPVSPLCVTSMVVVEHLTPAQRSVLLGRGAAELLAGANAAVVHGPLEAVLRVAEAEAQARRAAASGAGGAAPGSGAASGTVTVLAWAGFAQWSRTQLLGEVARGSWGWCDGSASDVALAAESQRSGCASGLWGALRWSERLAWAPENELSRDFDRHLSSVEVPAAERGNGRDPQAEAVDALVRQIEALRRGSDASSLRPQQLSPASGAEERQQQSSRGSRVGRIPSPCVHQ
eukprot:TRINITY_DN23624_c0_g1_i1.p1 TRINITY_DN23624_c0_g1~~TRINITY_DN23624_c0_g1_i1.p1  ORF type:complete len:434 (+),score=104.66 TRINITY_DN23624_c0_g1_i1:103-1404(+)